MASYIKIGYMHDMNPQEKSSCGYCKNRDDIKEKGHTSWGLGAGKLTCHDYQVMMDRGWRRCGEYFYKWDFETSCCQPYTIRLNVGDYTASKEQLKVMRRFNKFLQGEIGMDGKSVTEESKMDVDKPQIIDDRIEVVKTALASILKDQNWEFPQGVAISPA
jgi:arginyl-tRNA--protein-N-Asp/Glu arginylyltransferase